VLRTDGARRRIPETVVCNEISCDSFNAVRSFFPPRASYTPSRRVFPCRNGTVS
jgi:hypothetical protein